MHSVFWTLAKSDYRSSAVHRADKISAWREESPPKLDKDSFDHSYNAFVQESAIDEIAVAGGTDPLDLRRKLMSPYPVATKLISAIERMSGWKAPLAPNTGRGFAFAFSSGTWMANVVEVVQEETGIRVDRVICAADAGRVFNERSFRMQMIAAIVRELSSATGRKIIAEDRQPEITLELLGNSRHTGGGGELSAPPVVPALANAVFALTGKRIRRIPIGDEVDFI